MFKDKNIKFEVVKSLLSSGIAFIVDFTILLILSTIFNFNYILAITIAFLAGAWVNYAISINWVFNNRILKNKYTEFSIFILVGSVTLGGSIIIMFFFVDLLHVNLIVAKLLTTSLTFVANFAGRRLLLFRKTVCQTKRLYQS